MSPYKIKNKLKERDIVLNMLGTYPDCIRDLKAQKIDEDHERKFYECIYQNGYSYILFHRTRLTQFEIEDIRKNGISLGGKELLIEKIKNLPPTCDEHKGALIARVRDLPRTRAENCIYAYFGNFHLCNDVENDNVFFDYWGGESIYTCYLEDDSVGAEKMKKDLQCISKPCIIILRYPADIEGSLLQKNLYQRFMKNETCNIVGAVWVERFLPEVIDVVDLTQYSCFDFSW